MSLLSTSYIHLHLNKLVSEMLKFAIVVWNQQDKYAVLALWPKGRPRAVLWLCPIHSCSRHQSPLGFVISASANQGACHVFHPHKTPSLSCCASIIIPHDNLQFQESLSPEILLFKPRPLSLFLYPHLRLLACLETQNQNKWKRVTPSPFLCSSLLFPQASIKSFHIIHVFNMPHLDAHTRTYTQHSLLFLVTHFSVDG